MKYNSISDNTRSELFLLNEFNTETFDQFTLSGKVIEKMHIEAKKVTNLLSLAYGFRTVELVCDFIKSDVSENYFLVNVKSFKLEDTNYQLKVAENLHLIENQNAVLTSLRQVASDSSIFPIIE